MARRIIPAPGRSYSDPPSKTWNKVEDGVWRGLLGMAGSTNCVTITLGVTSTAPMTPEYWEQVEKKIAEILDAKKAKDDAR